DGLRRLLRGVRPEIRSPQESTWETMASQAPAAIISSTSLPRQLGGAAGRWSAESEAFSPESRRAWWLYGAGSVGLSPYKGSRWGGRGRKSPGASSLPPRTPSQDCFASWCVASTSQRFLAAVLSNSVSLGPNTTASGGSLPGLPRWRPAVCPA
ncbi:hypothetical protein TraAM80_04655, partial [Trypanosoma rangeli]